MKKAAAKKVSEAVGGAIPEQTPDPCIANPCLAKVAKVLLVPISLPFFGELVREWSRAPSAPWHCVAGSAVCARSCHKRHHLPQLPAINEWRLCVVPRLRIAIRHPFAAVHRCCAVLPKCRAAAFIFVETQCLLFAAIGAVIWACLQCLRAILTPCFFPVFVQGAHHAGTKEMINPV